MVAALLAESLSGQGFEVAVASAVAEARQAVREFDPDAAIVDICLGDGPSGLDFAHMLHQERPDIAVLFLTHLASPKAAGLGVQDIPPGTGFLRKDRVTEPSYLTSRINLVLSDNGDSVREGGEHSSPLGALSAKQLEILRLIALGYTNEHIARLKGAGLSTVERWVIQIFRDLGIDTRGELNPRVEATRIFVAESTVPQRP